MRPRLLDLFSGAGGAAKGYQRAGFYVVGVDKDPAAELLRRRVLARRGSMDRVEPVAVVEHMLEQVGQRVRLHEPPRRRYAVKDGVGDGYSDLIAATRELLMATGLPYVIENVEGAPLFNPVKLCGTGFGLDVQRHRLFETSFPLMGMPCAHGRHAARFPAATNRGENTRRTVEVGVWRIPLDVQQRAMGIDWMTLPELSEAIPPAYTTFIGEQLREHLALAEAA